MDAATAAQAIRAGEKVRMTVGVEQDDPVLIVWRDGAGVMSEAIAGWSAGTCDPVCGIDSDFLMKFLEGRAMLELATEGEASS